MAIDWEFISGKDIEGESEHLTGYVPAEGSGFTVGSFDIGQHNEEDLRTILQKYANKLDPNNPRGYGNIRQDLLERISPYALREDVSDVEARKISFKKEDIDYLTAAKRYDFEKSLSFLEGWGNLNPKMQTILGSVGWQYGINKPIFKDLYGLRGSEGNMISKLIEMGSAEYKHRRTKEAEYLDPTFSKMRRLDNPVGYRE